MVAYARAAPAQGSSEPDEVLVERVLRGDQAAFRQLYLRHSRYVAGAIVRWMGDDHELDDVVQDTFIRAIERLHTLRSPSHVRPWLVTVAVRFAQERLARRRRRGRLRQEVMHASATASDPRDRAPADELYAALDRLSDKLRVPWFLARIEGEKLEHVAVACGVSLATVKRRISQAQARLDRRLASSEPRRSGR